MVSPELIRRFSFFAGLESGEIEELAKNGNRIVAEENSLLFKEGEELECLYLLESGEIGIVLEATARGVSHSVSSQLTGSMETEDVVVSSVKDGEVFGWSSLIPPYEATAGARVMSEKADLVILDAVALRKVFEERPHFGYIMAIKIAQVSRQRLQDIRIESLAGKG